MKIANLRYKNILLHIPHSNKSENDIRNKAIINMHFLDEKEFSKVIEQILKNSKNKVIKILAIATIIELCGESPHLKVARKTIISGKKKNYNGELNNRTIENAVNTAFKNMLNKMIKNEMVKRYMKSRIENLEKIKNRGFEFEEKTQLSKSLTNAIKEVFKIGPDESEFLEEAFKYFKENGICYVFFDS